LTIINRLAIYSFFFNISLRKQLIYILYQMLLKKALLFITITIAFLRPDWVFNTPSLPTEKNSLPKSVELLSNKYLADQLIFNLKKKER